MRFSPRTEVEKLKLFIAFMDEFMKYKIDFKKLKKNVGLMIGNQWYSRSNENMRS